MGVSNNWKWKVYDIMDRLCDMTGHHFCHRLTPIFDWARKGDDDGNRE